MTHLHELLSNSPRRFLLAVSRACRLSVPWEASKTTLVDDLTQALQDRSRLIQLWSELSDTERAILRIIQAAEGRLPRRHLTHRFGKLRPYRPWRTGEPARPWENPASPVERLWYGGVIFWDRKNDDLVIPSELLPHLPGLVSETLPAPAGTISRYQPVDLACHDLAVLLALLQRDDITPRQQRWLTPNILTVWGQACRVQPTAPEARGELQTNRRRFLHYLAENAGWLPPGSAFLKPTPAAWLWLRATRPEQFTALWHSWSQPHPDCWRAFRLPGNRWLSQPEILLAAIHRHLPRLNPGEPGLLAQLMLTRQPELLDLFPANVLNVENLWVQTITEILTGPLVWLGALRIENMPADSAAPMYSLTAVGRAWLENTPPVRTDNPAYARFAVKADIQPDFLNSKLGLSLTEGLPAPLNLATALELSEPSDPNQISAAERLPARYQFTISAASFIRALHRGGAGQALLDGVQQLADRALTGQETGLLRQWAEAAHKITLRYALLLESADAQVITRLTATRRGRDLIQRTLSPRAVIVDPGRLGPLARRLTAQEGVPPAMPGNRAGAPDKDTPFSTGEAAQLWLTIRVYQALGQFIKLPGHISQTVLDQLTPLLNEADLAAGETTAAEIIDTLRQVIDGRAAFPPWSAENPAVGNILPVIERALAAGNLLELHYYAAGSETLTRRQVEPYRLEWRGDTPYLVGFCRYRQAERVFRVDRIQKITILPPDH